MRTEPHRADAATSAGPTPVIVGIVAGLAALFFVFGRVMVHDGDVTALIRIGTERMSTEADRRSDLDLVEGTGYDGQYFYRQAIDPLSTDERVDGISLDRPAYRSARIGYPALVWALSLGGEREIVKWMMPGVNIACVGLIGAIGASIARGMNRSGWYGLLFAWWPGMVIGLAYNLSEPLEATLVVAAIALLRRHATVAAALVLSYAAITRETALLVSAAVLAVGALRLLDRRAPVWVTRWVRPTAPTPWLVGVLPIATFAATQVWIASRWDEGSTKAAQKSISFISVPLLALGRQVLEWITAPDVVGLYQLIQVALIALLMAALARSLGDRDAGTAVERVAFVGALAAVVMLPAWDRMVIFLRYPDIAVLFGLTLLASTDVSRLPDWASPRMVIKIGALLLASVVPIWIAI